MNSLRKLIGFLATRVMLAAFALQAAADVVIAPPNKGTLYLETGAFGLMQFRWDKPQTEETNPPDIIQKIIDKSLTTWKLQDLCLVKLLESTPTPGGLVTLPAERRIHRRPHRHQE